MSLAPKQPAKSIRELLKDPKNVAAHQKFKAMAESHEKKKADLAKFFDPVALMARANEVHQVRHPQLGIIRFGELMLSDSEIVSKCKTKDDRSAMAVYLDAEKGLSRNARLHARDYRGFLPCFSDG